MKRLLLASALLLLTSCSDADGATRVLQQAGYTNIQTTGYAWFGCSEDDTWATGFVATSVSGDRVEGVVCAGLMKGATIRVF